jgi:hypothetical protein
LRNGKKSPPPLLSRSSAVETVGLVHRNSGRAFPRRKKMNVGVRPGYTRTHWIAWIVRPVAGARIAGEVPHKPYNLDLISKPGAQRLPANHRATQDGEGFVNCVTSCPWVPVRRTAAARPFASLGISKVHGPAKGAADDRRPRSRRQKTSSEQCSATNCRPECNRANRKRVFGSTGSVKIFRQRLAFFPAGFASAGLKR